MRYSGSHLGLSCPGFFDYKPKTSESIVASDVPQSEATCSGNVEPRPCIGMLEVLLLLGLVEIDLGPDVEHVAKEGRIQCFGAPLALFVTWLQH